MSKKIDIDEILMNYIQKGVEAAGSRLEFSKRIDVAHTTVRDWVTGKSKTMRLDVLLRVLKEIKVFMPAEQYDQYMNLWGEGKVIAYSASQEEKLEDSDNIVISFLRKIVPMLSVEEKNSLIEYALTLQNKKNKIGENEK